MKILGQLLIVLCIVSTASAETAENEPMVRCQPVETKMTEMRVQCSAHWEQEFNPPNWEFCWSRQTCSEVEISHKSTVKPVFVIGEDRFGEAGKVTAYVYDDAASELLKPSAEICWDNKTKILVRRVLSELFSVDAEGEHTALPEYDSVCFKPG